MDCVNELDEFELYELVLKLSDKDKIKSLSKFSSLNFKSLIISSLSNDSDKEYLLPLLIGLSYQVNVIVSFNSDELKIKYLSELISDMKAKVIASFKSEELKIKYFSLAKTDKDKIIIIKSFKTDENRLWGLNKLEKDKYKATIINYFEDVDFITLALDKINDYAFKLEALINLKTKIRKLIVFRTTGKFQADILASINDITFKLDMLNKISPEYRIVVILTLPDIYKEKYLLSKMNYLDKMAIVYSLKDKIIKEKWIKTLGKPLEFDLGIDPRLQFGLEIETEGVLNAFLCQIWNIENDYFGTLDSSLNNGIEVKTPKLHNTCLELECLFYVFNLLNKAGFNCSNRCGGHIHFDQSYLKSVKEYIILFEIWSYTERIFYLILNAEGCMPRDSIPFFAISFFESIKGSLIKNVIYNDLKKKDEEFLNSLALWQITKNNSLNFRHVNKDMHTMEFRCPNGSISFSLWMQNIKLLGRLLMVCKAISNIDLKNASSDEMLLWSKKEMLKNNINEEEKLEILLDLLFTDTEKKLYRNKYYVNKNLVDNSINNPLKNIEFKGLDMARILRKEF